MIGFFDVRENKIVGQTIDGVFRVRGRLKEFLDLIEQTGEMLFRTGESSDEGAQESWDVISVDDPNAPELLVDTLERLDIVLCNI